MDSHPINRVQQVKFQVVGAVVPDKDCDMQDASGEMEGHNVYVANMGLC